MSRWGWIIVGVRKKVGTAAPARFMPPTQKRQIHRYSYNVYALDNNYDCLTIKIITGTNAVMTVSSDILSKSIK